MRLAAFSAGDAVLAAACLVVFAVLAFAGGSWATNKSEQAEKEGRGGHALGWFFVFLLVGLPLAWFVLSVQGAATTAPTPTPYAPPRVP